MSQPLCFDIGYWGSYRLFQSKELQWIKIKNIYIACITLKIIFWIKYIPLAGGSVVEPQLFGVYLYAYIY